MINGATLPQQAYVWQRAWTDDVRLAIQEHSSSFERLLVLGAEVSWRRNQPGVIRVPVDWEALRKANRPIGVALRIGPFPGPFASSGEPIDSLARLATALLHDAETQQVQVAELQIDFDCADSKLSGYRTWLEVMRKRVAPVPLTITTLPSWLKQPEFPKLISVTASYVLQVHSLERPENINSRFTLCSLPAARAAVERAGRFGVPFRVALPTYGYSVAFDRNGKFTGLSAEGPSRAWPADAQIRSVESNSAEIASLVRDWTSHVPASCEGIIWYRLPVRSDALNWPWPTLAAVMAGRKPNANLRAVAESNEDGLVDLRLRNDGELGVPTPSKILVRWGKGKLLAGDAVQGYELVEREPLQAEFERKSTRGQIGPGSTLAIGWLRLSHKQKIEVQVLTEGVTHAERDRSEKR